MEHFGGQLADEMDVVGDKDQCSLVTCEREDERFDAVDVEVGRRLVHEEEVRRVHQEFDEVEPTFFTAAQNPGFFVNVILAEKE